MDLDIVVAQGFVLILQLLPGIPLLPLRLTIPAETCHAMRCPWRKCQSLTSGSTLNPAGRHYHLLVCRDAMRVLQQPECNDATSYSQSKWPFLLDLALRLKPWISCFLQFRSAPASLAHTKQIDHQALTLKTTATHLSSGKNPLGGTTELLYLLFQLPNGVAAVYAHVMPQRAGHDTIL